MSLGSIRRDALGSLVESQSAEQIRREYPNGVRDLADGGTHNTIAGQPTDDSEMALMLARTLIHRGRFDSEAVRNAYLLWLASEPFDCGGTTVYSGLRGKHNADSQANGALMRISPARHIRRQSQLRLGAGLRVGTPRCRAYTYPSRLSAGQCPICNGDCPRHPHGMHPPTRYIARSQHGRKGCTQNATCTM